MELVDRRVMVEVRELGAEVELLGLRVEAEEARGGGKGYSSPGDTGGWQTHGGSHCTDRGLTAVEEAGAGGRAGIFEERHWRALSRSGHWKIWSPLPVQQSQMCRARRPGSWWRLLTTKTVLYGRERSVPLFQQEEEEEFGPDEGIHGAQRKQKTLGKKN